MGVPSFFRWLNRKYPSVVVECNEDVKYDHDENLIPVDATKPNPNGIEFDNLYLDMNGIIHPCTHPEDKPAPKSEDEMMIAIFECIDRLFGIVRPRKLIYMAIDGVAPRAKMNQQRSRRFRAAKESQEKKAEIARIRQELTDKGMRLPPQKEVEFHFDSNCITPGTPFMDRLSKCLHYYIHDKVNNDAAWQGIKVILSDANVPGEGEHKIVDFIRKQRAQPGHDPNTQHMLCGADADLIMLGLATHEVNFTIIREEFTPNKNRPCEICGKTTHALSECQGLKQDETFEETNVFSKTNYIFVRLNVLREYLEKELVMDNLPFDYNFDRALDDWVFMCFFVGNDFLPHLPSLEIRENAIDRLIRLYKDCCYKTGGWLTDSGIANLSRVQQIMNCLGRVEDEIFRNRRRQDISFKRRNKRMKFDDMREKESAYRFAAQEGLVALGSTSDSSTSVSRGGYHGMRGQMNANENRKRPHEDSDEEDNDEVKLYEDGFKDRYYESKFEVLADNITFRTKVANEYAIGLCWVLRYYFQGCPSWKWYYPYHYSPFASDFNECSSLEVEFQIGEPFAPMQQLMGVFPAASRSHVPEPWGELMIDPMSTIIDFYPEDFKIDMNGKRMAYLGVALLPFVEERRLKHALEAVKDLLTNDEWKRNQTLDSVFYVGKRHKGYAQLRDIYRMGMNSDTQVPFDGNDFEGLAGILMLADNVIPANGALVSPVNGLEDIKDNSTVTVKYRNPSYAADFLFPTKKLEGAVDPPRILKGDQSDKSGNYRPYIGFTRGNRRASLSNAGHRMISNSSDDRHSEEYGSVAPPSGNNYKGRRNYGQSSPYGNSSFNSSKQNQSRWRNDRDDLGRGGRNFQQRGGYGNNSGYNTSNDYNNSGGSSYNSNRNYNNSGRGGYNSGGSYNSNKNYGNQDYNSSNNYRGRSRFR